MYYISGWPMANDSDRFILTPELGQELRALRVRAGLSQQQVALRMGRKGKGAHTLVGNLERARVKHPTLGLVADFLRACRAKLSDIADIIDQYTSQPLVAEKRGTEAVQEFVDKLPEPLAREASHCDFKVEASRRFSGGPVAVEAEARTSAQPGVRRDRSRVQRQPAQRACQSRPQCLGNPEPDTPAPA
jgi:transcriptional regulator with XRE-family HTH domain